MDQYVNLLQSEVEESLHVIGEDQDDILKRSRKCILLLEKAFEDLKAYVEAYTFKDEAEEIRFFKEIKPAFFSNLIFYKKVYSVEVLRPKGGDKIQQAYFRGELSEIHSYFMKYMEFYKYYRADCTHLDKEYFTRGKQSLHIIHESFYFDRNPSFTTQCDFIIAQILANEMIESYLMAEIARLENYVVNLDSDLFARVKLEWNGPKIDLIEMIYAIHETGYINNGTKSLKLLIAIFERLFNTELGNVSRGMYDLKHRDNPTKFLDELKKLLLRKILNEDKKKKK